MDELGNAALGNGHSECVGRELASERVAHGPAHNSSGIHIQHGRQVQPALACWDVDHIAEPASIGPLGFKAPPDQVGEDLLGIARVRRYPAAADRLGHNLRSAHQLGDCVATAGNPLNREFRVYSRCAIRLAAGKVDVPDLGGQRRLPMNPCAGRPAPGCVVPTGRNAQGPTQRAHCILPALAFDKGVFHLDAFAKEMAAFFKISFSSRSLAFARRRVPRFCSAVASSCLGTPLRSSSSKSRRHWRNWFTRTPSSRATLALVLSPTAAKRTASSLNSRVWCLRSLRSMTQTSYGNCACLELSTKRG